MFIDDAITILSKIREEKGNLELVLVRDGEIWEPFFYERQSIPALEWDTPCVEIA